jgi:hypothetical protein
MVGIVSGDLSRSPRSRLMPRLGMFLNAAHLDALEAAYRNVPKCGIE